MRGLKRPIVPTSIAFVLVFLLTTKWACADLINVASNRPVSGSPAYQGRAEFAKENLVDEDEATQAYPGWYSFTYEVDLEGGYRIDRVELVWRDYGTDPRYITAWDLQVSGNRVDWETAARGGFPNAETTVVTLSRPGIRYVRVWAESYNPDRTPRNWIGIYELRAFTDSLPQITRLVPDVGLPGDSIDVEGSHFWPDAQVRIGGVLATSSTLSDSRIRVTIPDIPPGAASLQVENPSGGRSSSVPFLRLAGANPAPLLYSASPRYGVIGRLPDVYLYGEYIEEATQVVFGSSEATIIERTPSYLKVSPPPLEAGNVTVTVLTPGGSATLDSMFTYTEPRNVRIGEINPSIPNAGMYIRISPGAGFSGTTRVLIDGQETDSYVLDDNDLYAKIQDGLAGQVSLVVINDDTQTSDQAVITVEDTELGATQCRVEEFVARRSPAADDFRTGGFPQDSVWLFAPDSRDRCPQLQFKKAGDPSSRYRSLFPCDPDFPCYQPRKWIVPAPNVFAETIAAPTKMDVKVVCPNSTSAENLSFNYYVIPKQVSSQPNPREGSRGTFVTVEAEDLIQKIDGVDHVVAPYRLFMYQRECASPPCWNKNFNRSQICPSGCPVTVARIGDSESRRNSLRFQIPPDAPTGDIFIGVSYQPTRCEQDEGYERNLGKTLTFNVRSPGGVILSADPSTLFLRLGQAGEARSTARVASDGVFQGTVRLKAEFAGSTPSNVTLSFENGSTCDGRPCIDLDVNPGPGSAAIFKATTSGTSSRGVFTIRLTAHYPAENPTASETRWLTLHISDPLTLSPLSLPGGSQGSPYTGFLFASGGAPPYTWCYPPYTPTCGGLTGALPSGLIGNGIGPTLGFTGTPTQQGFYTFQIKLQDAVGAEVLRTYSITIGPPAPSFAYVPNFNSNTVSVVNMSTGVVRSTINVGRSPSGIALVTRGDVQYAYVTNVSSDTISVIDTRNNAITATIPVDPAPASIAAVGDPLNRAIVPHSTLPGKVSIINLETNRVITTLPISTPGSPELVVIPRENYTRAYVLNTRSSDGYKVSVIDTISNRIVRQITSPMALPSSLAVNQDGSRAYVAVGPWLDCLDTLSGQLVYRTQPPLVEAWDMGVGSDGLLYVSNSNMIKILNPQDGSLVANVSGVGDGYRFTFSQDGRKLYLISRVQPPSGSITVIDTTSRTVTDVFRNLGLSLPTGIVIKRN